MRIADSKDIYIFQRVVSSLIVQRIKGLNAEISQLQLTVTN